MINVTFSFSSIEILQQPHPFLALAMCGQLAETNHISTSNTSNINIKPHKQQHPGPKIIIGLAQLANWLPESWCPKDGFQAWSKATYCLPRSERLDKEPIWAGRRLSSLRFCLFLPLRHPSGLSSSPLPLTCFWAPWCALAIPLLLILSRLVLLGRTILSCRRHTFRCWYTSHTKYILYSYTCPPRWRWLYYPWKIWFDTHKLSRVVHL